MPFVNVSAMRIWWLAAALVLASSNVVAADPAAFAIGDQPAWFLLGGVTGGGTIEFHDRGGFVGGELSVARLDAGNYFGAFANADYDFGVHGTTVTGGLEAGHKLVGVDVGPAMRWFRGDTDFGVAARINVSIGAFGIYARYEYFDAAADAHVIQLGATLKLPFVSPF
jgi:hypothetical protein